MENLEAMKFFDSYMVVLVTVALILIMMQPFTVSFMNEAIPESNTRTIVMVTIVASLLFLYCGCNDVRMGTNSAPKS